MNPAAVTLLALLVAGHLLGDFVFQTRAMVAGKRARWGPRLAHAAEIAVVQGAVALPFFPSARGAVAILVIAVAHLLIDAAKVALDKRFARPVTWFVLDQLAHLAVLLFVMGLWVPLDTWLRGRELGVVTGLACAAGAVAFNVNGGSALVAGLLAQLRRPGQAPDDAAPGAGRLVGILERLLVLAAVTAGEWGAVGLVLAGKSVARFKALEQSREFAEIYLVGTLASVLVAVASGLALDGLLDALGVFAENGASGALPLHFHGR